MSIILGKNDTIQFDEVFVAATKDLPSSCTICPCTVLHASAIPIHLDPSVSPDASTPCSVRCHVAWVPGKMAEVHILDLPKKTTGRLIHLDVTLIQIGPLWYTSVPAEPFCMRHLLHSPSPNLPAAYVLSPRHSLALWRSWEDSSFGEIGIKHPLTSPVVTGHLWETVISSRQTCCTVFGIW